MGSPRAASFGALVLLLVGCPPTLSRPDSATHLDAMAEGARHTHHGRHDDAASSFSRAAEAAVRRVDHDEALYRRARALRREGRDADALEVLGRIASRRPPSRRTARALYDAGRLRLERLDQVDAGLAGLQAVVEAFPDSGIASQALRRWISWVETHEGPAAARALVMTLYPAHATDSLGDDLLLRAHQLALGAGDRRAARAALERIVREHPYPRGHRWDDAILRLAGMDEEEGRLLDAVARLKAMLERAESTSVVGSYTLPTFPRAALRIARLEREMGRWEDAEAAYRRVGARFPDSTLRDDALVELAEMKRERGEEASACALFRQVARDFEVGSARRRAAESALRCEARDP